MNPFAKKISFLIDQRYARTMKVGKPFNPLLQPSLFGLYLLSIASRLFGQTSPQANVCLSRKSRLMSFLGHRVFPNKYGVCGLSDNEISNKRFRFSDAPDPIVSFLVLCDDDLDGIIRLLESIEANSSEIGVEVIVILGEEKKKTSQFVENNLYGVGVYTSNVTDGLMNTLNLAITNSKGQFVSVLKSGVSLQPGWLGNMVSEISKDDRVAIVSGKVFSSDGLLDEAGTFVNAESQFHKYGKSDLADRPKYNFLRKIECTAGSNSLIRKSDFEKVGRFDLTSSSLEAAFIRLSFVLRKSLGKKILYTPLAEAIRRKLETFGQVDVSGMLDSTIERSLDDDYNARKLLAPRSVLFIDIGLPEHDRDSGSLRAFYLLKILLELGNHVIVVPRKGQVFSPYFDELIGLGVEVLYAFPDRKGMIKELTALLPSVAIAWICRPQLNAEFEWIFKINPKIKWVFDTIDLHYVRLAREATLFNRKKLMKKSARFKKLELSMASKADLTLTVTEDEKNLLCEQGIKRVAVIPNIHEIHQLGEYPGFSERQGLLFIGSYHHPPNIDAARWLVDEIMPIVWDKLPIPVTLLGNAPTKEVKSLETDLVKVPGYVKDVAPFFGSHRVFVAPLRYGAGMKGKIGQSLAYKLPIVTTAIGAEGVGLTHAVDVLIADDKESFAEQIINAYQDEQRWRTLASNSEKVLRKYSPQQIRENLATILEELR